MAKFERVLKGHFHFSDQDLAPYRGLPCVGETRLGPANCTRLQVHWYYWPKGEKPTFSQLEPCATAEFDLRTGETKHFGFRDLRLVNGFLRGQTTSE